MSTKPSDPFKDLILGVIAQVIIYGILCLIFFIIIEIISFFNPNRNQIHTESDNSNYSKDEDADFIDDREYICGRC